MFKYVCNRVSSIRAFSQHFLVAFPFCRTRGGSEKSDENDKRAWENSHREKVFKIIGGNGCQNACKH